MIVKQNRIIIAIIAAAAALPSAAEVDIDYSATLAAGVADGGLAPYHIATMEGGRFTSGGMTLLGLEAHHSMSDSTRWAWGAGVEVWGGYNRKASYGRYNGSTGQMTVNWQRPAALWLQQAYVSGRYRGMTLTIGQREQRPVTVGRNSSGDLTRSGNSRPLPGAGLRFRDFLDVPLTRGWVQALMELSFNCSTDASWIENHYVGRGGFVTTGYWLSYKSLYLRSKPSQLVVVTLGLQTNCQFGGTKTSYDLQGNVTGVEKMESDFKTFLKSVVPGGESGTTNPDKFCVGNHVGSVDVAVDWHIGQTGKTLRAYLQNPFEDGSSLGKMNGWDGLWGLEYRAGEHDAVSNIVVEYLDLTNQSGPMHWAPADNPGTQVPNQATGADDYYNNHAYNGYHTAGLSIGSPMVSSPLWNRDGYMQYRDNLLRGVHVAVEGELTREWRYRAVYSHRKAWGTPFVPRVTGVTADCFLLEATYVPRRMPRLAVRARLGIDRGTLAGNNVGGLVTATYSGDFSF